MIKIIDINGVEHNIYSVDLKEWILAGQVSSYIDISGNGVTVKTENTVKKK